MEKDPNNILDEVTQGEYKYGFYTDIEMDMAPAGLSEDTIRFISAKKNEPEWLLKYRLDAFKKWLGMTEPTWAHLHHPPINYQDIIYYAAPKRKKELSSLDEVDPELIETFNKLGISLEEQKRLSGVAVDAVIDSVSVKTTFSETLEKQGIIFCSFSEAVQKVPDLIKQYLGTVVPSTDNYFAALNSAVFSDGSFCYIPKGVRCPIELSTYFRINAANTGQFERTLIIADEGSYVSYMEGCTAPMRDENQLHAAIVEIIALKDAEVKYSIGEFYSVAVTNNYQQADTGSKMIHLGKNTKSTIISKGISAGRSSNSYRGLVKMTKRAENSRNFSQCDSLLLGDRCGAHTYPYIKTENKSSIVEHEATTSKISDDQLFYCNQRGINTENAIGLIVNGYAREVLKQLPMEFAVEAQKLLSISLEGSVG